MSSSTLSNYIRSNRKRFGFSQWEIARLLGCVKGEAISRYERFARLPGLETALAFEIIFKIPVRDLFLGESRKVERAIRRRAKRLAATIETHGEKVNGIKVARLREIISGDGGE